MARLCVNRRADRAASNLMENISENAYIRQVLTAFCQTPTTIGRANRQDRLLAARFYRRQVPLDVIENALLLGAVRRLYRDPNDLPLAPVRSLHYFCALIDEVCDLKTHPKTRSTYPRYFEYLRYKIKTFDELKQQFLQSQKT